MSTESFVINKSRILGTFTWVQIPKKNFEVGPEVVQPGPELVHSNISSTVVALQLKII